MDNEKRKVSFLNRSTLRIAGLMALLLLAVLLLWYGNKTSYQATPALVAQVRFEGEYRIADGPWQEIVTGQHIPATKGDVTLRGNFHLWAPNGEYIGIYSADMPIALYIDHVNLTFFVGEEEPFGIDVENPLYGKSLCGICWSAYTFTRETEEPIEILVHNPHNFGNETAIDELLANIALWSGLEFEKGILESGEYQRNTGFVFVVVAALVFGIALFSTLIHNTNNKILWIMSLVILFAGGYFIFSASGVYFWNESIVTNTTILGITMMLYMLFLAVGIVYFLNASKKMGTIAVTCLGAIDALLFVIPVVMDRQFYDMWSYWAMVQLIVNLVLVGCLVKECFYKGNKNKWLYVGAIFLLLAFGVDLVMTEVGIWKGGVISEVAFIALLVAAMVMVLRVIPENINAAEKAKELELQRSRLEAEKNIVEAELKESRVAIMLSQIQPHFIYNTLGTIERMCLKDPKKANELVHNFSLYLRGNFRELDSIIPIRFVEELKHIEYYVSIEKVRFPDMNIEYEIETTEFVLPALSVQPLVENAIKHGLMRLESGGTVRIRSYETPTHFCVEVKDDGPGFDTSLPIDGKKHVGLRNIRGRLKAMVDGELTLESEPGAGTKAVIMIPKE